MEERRRRRKRRGGGEGEKKIDNSKKDLGTMPALTQLHHCITAAYIISRPYTSPGCWGVGTTPAPPSTGDTQ